MHGEVVQHAVRAGKSRRGFDMVAAAMHVVVALAEGVSMYRRL